MANSVSSFPAWPTIAVKDLAEARKFYEDTLGYSKTVMESDNAVAYMGADGTGILIYPSAENAGTNKATSASWMVKDFDGVMSDLRSKGVEFEEYDQPGLKTENGVAKWEEGGKSMKSAWFKDPDGNILNIGEM
jgi:catechol 2,3-dioxygenase-like lactoylglutathione lyase family enzyme